jgi:hypothetical protein
MAEGLLKISRIDIPNQACIRDKDLSKHTRENLERFVKLVSIMRLTDLSQDKIGRK